LHDFDPKRFSNGDDVVLLLRTIAESTNGPGALTLPIVKAVSSCMKPAWTDLGLRWLEAMDAIDLVGLHTTLTDLALEDQLGRVLYRRLEEILGPPVAKPQPKPKPKPKTKEKPPGISAASWEEALRIHGKKPRPKAQVAA
jgi:hypothetical protein